MTDVTRTDTTKKRHYAHKFVQIASDARNGIHALAEDGSVWKYHPSYEKEQKNGETKTVFAKWGMLTQYRMDPNS